MRRREPRFAGAAAQQRNGAAGVVPEALRRERNDGVARPRLEGRRRVRVASDVEGQRDEALPSSERRRLDGGPFERPRGDGPPVDEPPDIYGEAQRGRGAIDARVVEKRLLEARDGRVHRGHEPHEAGVGFGVGGEPHGMEQGLYRGPDDQEAREKVDVAARRRGPRLCFEAAERLLDGPRQRRLKGVARGREERLERRLEERLGL
mmetsp:Transcript_25279/g.90303  ORF Transcript_25279/g.90303 Transcript_25279/m.90303 type:complete len:206 (+) Transcript_25279:1734-2351(+)